MTDESAERRPNVRPAVPSAESATRPDRVTSPPDQNPSEAARSDAPRSGPTDGDIEVSAASLRREWRVPGHTTALKAAGAAGFAVAGLALAYDTASLVVAIAAAAVIGWYALRDVVAPVRLRADGDGVVVITGYATRKRIPWRDVERIRIDERTRLGLRSELLEIDTGSTLHLFSASELGAPLEEVAEALRHLRTGR